MEPAFLRAVRLLPYGLGVAAVGLIVPLPNQPLGVVIGHLTALVGLGMLATGLMATHADVPWLENTRLGPAGRAFWSAGMIVSFATGLVALVTLASSAALGYDPSLQFLQLLSALDIAWAGGALFLGVRWLKGVPVAWAATGGLGLVCIWSIWNYLRVVGFTATGGWLVDGPALMRYVIPFDMAAASMAIWALWRGSVYFTAQRNPQS